MIKIINGIKYNTDTAECIYDYSNGNNYRDFKHRSKTLYRTKLGRWFIHHVGGPMTDMGRDMGNGVTGGSKKIEPISDDDCYRFLEAHSEDQDAQDAIDKYFSDRVEEA